MTGRWCGSVLAACLALGAVEARASGPTEDVAQARKAYLAADFARALELYERALIQESEASARAQLHLARAQCFAALQDKRALVQALTRVLENDPTVALDQNRVDPALVEQLEALRARLRGTLEVHVQPADAQVSLDKTPIVLPFRGEVALGLHTLEALDAQGQRFTQDVTVAANHPQTVTLVIPQAAKPQPQVEASPPPVLAPDTPAPSPWAAELRLNLSDLGGVSPEANVLWSRHLFRASGGLLLGSSPALVFRVGAETLPWFQRATLYATFNGVFFSQDRFQLLGPGVSLGGTWRFFPWLAAVVELSGWQLYEQGRFQDRYAVGSLGARMRWP